MSNLYYLLLVLLVYSCNSGSIYENSEGSDYTLKPSTNLNPIDAEGRNVDSFELSNDSLSYRCIARRGNRNEYDESILYVDFRISHLRSNNDFFNSLFSNEEQGKILMEELQFSGINLFKLTSETDTIYPHIYHFESSHGLSPFITFLLGFDMADINDSKFKLNFRHPNFEKGNLIKVEL